MHREDEILQALRELKDAQKVHHEEWRAALEEARQKHEDALRRVSKTKRASWVVIGALAVYLLATGFLPTVLEIISFYSSSRELARYSNPIPTSQFDGTYALDRERSLADLRARKVQLGRTSEETVMDLVARLFRDFQIRHGVITSGVELVQEFRLTDGKMNDGRLEGRAIWHEDIHDPGDFSIVNVRLQMEGDLLRFAFFDDGEDAEKTVFLRRTGP